MFTHSDSDGCNLVSSILLKDTSTCRLENPGFEPPTFWEAHYPLYLPGHRLPMMASDSMLWDAMSHRIKSVCDWMSLMQGCPQMIKTWRKKSSFWNDKHFYKKNTFFLTSVLTQWPVSACYLIGSFWHSFRVTEHYVVLTAPVADVTVKAQLRLLPLTTSLNGRVSMCVLMPRDVPHCVWAACILQGNSCTALTGIDK